MKDADFVSSFEPMGCKRERWPAQLLPCYRAHIQEHAGRLNLSLREAVELAIDKMFGPPPGKPKVRRRGRPPKDRAA